LQIISEANQIEEQQIQDQIDKRNLKKQEYVIVEQTTQQINCHSCPSRTVIISKESFYKFPDGKAVFFCNDQERDQWMKNNKFS